MATYNFYLKDVNSKKETAVFLYVRWKNKLLKQYIGESIHPKYWDQENKRAKSRAFPGYAEFNSRLDKVEETAKDVYRRFRNDNEQRQPTFNELKSNLRLALKIDEVNSASLFNFYEKFIEDSKSSKGLKTIQWYNNTLRQLKEFQIKMRSKIDFDNLDMDFYHSFMSFLLSEQTVKNKDGQITRKYYLSANTIGKHIQNLKAVLNEAEARGIEVNPAYRLRGFKKPSEDSVNIYLNEDELSKLYKLNLSDKPRWEKVRDLFLVGCYTGLRYSDFSNLRKQDFQGEFINLQSVAKTKQPLLIPLHPIVKAIREKYSDRPNSLPESISDQKFRDYLKEVCQMIPDLNEPVLKTITKGGETKTYEKKKWEMVGTHTARRSFATNEYNSGTDAMTIMAITGHKSEKTFLKYIKTSPKEHAIRMQKNWEKRNKLKAV